jgi:DNA polymerase III epsilon subunit-like protein
MKILGLDLETQHDDAKTCPITEVGAVLIEIDPDIDPGKHKILRQESFCQLVYHPKYPPQTELIVELTGITDEMLKKDGQEPRVVLPKLIPYLEQADYVMAHYKQFDQTVLESVCARIGVPLGKYEWICSLTDVPWPKKYTCRKLSHLAFEHGMQVDVKSLHRAVQDVELMLQLVLGHYHIYDILKYRNTPWAYVQADIPAPWTDKGVGKAAASKRGYGWEKAKGTEEPVFPKTWVKRLKADQVEKERNEAPFSITELEGKS